MVWYYCSSLGLVLSVIKLFAYCRVGLGIGCGVMARCKFHIPDTPLWVPSRTICTFFSTVICVEVNMAVHISSNTRPREIIDPDWMWGKMCDVLYFIDNKGMRFSSAIWVACTRLTYGISTSGPCIVLNLFSHAVSTLM